MQEALSWGWVETQATLTAEVWQSCAALPAAIGPMYSPVEQRRRELAYDEALANVEGEAKRQPRSRLERLAAQDRVTSAFARFSSAALDLKEDAVELLTNDFLPVGTRLARWARRFDQGLSREDIIQANRNAWTACGLQPLLGERIELTPSILGYSLLYPYTDNFLDRTDVAGEEKRRFSQRFRQRLEGEPVCARDAREAALWALVELIERQYARASYAQVYDGLLAIHRAQEESIAQMDGDYAESELLRMSCTKGGSSVLADAAMARGWLGETESRFAFEWGVLLQLGDDLQDVREDLERGSATLFSRVAALGMPLDGLTKQLFAFSDRVAERMDALEHGSAMLKELLRTSWRSLIVGAVAGSRQFFSSEFVAETEQRSPFRFDFLRKRRKRLLSRRGLYNTLFEAFLEASEDDDLEQRLPVPALTVV